MLSSKIFPVVCVGLLGLVLFEVYPICLLSMDAINQSMYPGRLATKEYHNFNNFYFIVLMQWLMLTTGFFFHKHTAFQRIPSVTFSSQTALL